MFDLAVLDATLSNLIYTGVSCGNDQWVRYSKSMIISTPWIPSVSFYLQIKIDYLKDEEMSVDCSI